jgi:hypothetical protein
MNKLAIRSGTVLIEADIAASPLKERQPRWGLVIQGGGNRAEPCPQVKSDNFDLQLKRCVFEANFFSDIPQQFGQAL